MRLAQRRRCWGLKNTYKLRRHGSVQVNMTLAIPVGIQVDLDAIMRSLGDDDIGKHDRRGAEVELGEMQSRQRTWENGLEHRLNNVLDHVATGNIDVGP
jgi:hypothetical protein